MSKKSIRIISTVLTIVIVLMTLTSTAFALNSPSGVLTNVTLNHDAENKITGVGNQIATIIRTVGMIIAVIILMVLGIKYMMGSSEEKASYKKTMIPYIVGAVLLFAASGLAGMIFDFAQGVA